MAKAIKIEDTAALTDALDAVNGAATAHTYNALEVQALAEKAEKELAALGLPKNLRKGAVVASTSGAKVANAYRHSRKATFVMLQRKTAGWVVVSVNSADVYQTGGITRLTLTQAQDAKAIMELRRRYQVAAS